MAYVYEDVEDLQDQPKVGSKHCVALVQLYAKTPVTGTWKQGPLVKGNVTLKKGTAVGTFVDGRYPNNKTGNHAALYLEQDNTGIKVMDQWKDDVNKPNISSRWIRFKGVVKGKLIEPLSNNGDAYYVID